MEIENQAGAKAANPPILNKLGGVFIPVTDIYKARDWYCRMMGFPNDIPVYFDHLCPLPVEGPGVILDTMPKWGGKDPAGAPVHKAPSVMFTTHHLEASYRFMKDEGVELVTAIEDDHYFVFKDLDGNMLMLCQAPN